MFQKPNTVPTPDEFFDKAIKDCNGSEIKLLAVVINKTFRWGKLWDYISTPQFIEETNLSNRAVIDGLRHLEQKGWVQSAYICSHCGQIIEQIFYGEKTTKRRGKWEKQPSSRCSCGSYEMPNKWYAAKIQGEDLLDHLRLIYKKSNKSFNDTTPGQVMKKVHEGHEKSSRAGHEKSSYTGNLLGNQSNHPSENPNFIDNEKSDDDDDDNKTKRLSNPDSKFLSTMDSKTLNELTEYMANIRKWLLEYDAIEEPSIRNQRVVEVPLLRRWFDAGIPEACVLAGVRTTMSRHKKGKKIQSVKYFEKEVQNAFAEYNKVKAQDKAIKDSTSKALSRMKELLYGKQAGSV